MAIYYERKGVLKYHMKLSDTFQSVKKVAKTSSTRNNVFSNFILSYYPLLILI